MAGLERAHPRKLCKGAFGQFNRFADELKAEETIAGARYGAATTK